MRRGQSGRSSPWRLPSRNVNETLVESCETMFLTQTTMLSSTSPELCQSPDVSVVPKSDHVVSFPENNNTSLATNKTKNQISSSHHFHTSNSRGFQLFRISSVRQPEQSAKSCLGFCQKGPFNFSERSKDFLPESCLEAFPIRNSEPLRSLVQQEWAHHF